MKTGLLTAKLALEALDKSQGKIKIPYKKRENQETQRILYQASNGILIAFSEVKAGAIIKKMSHKKGESYQLYSGSCEITVEDFNPVTLLPRDKPFCIAPNLEYSLFFKEGAVYVNAQQCT